MNPSLMLAEGAVDGRLWVINQVLAANLRESMIHAAADLWRCTPELDEALVVDA